MDSSSLLPPIGISLLITIPPSDIIDTSVVSEPISTTITPLALVTSRSSPTASAIGFSTILIFLHLTSELATKS